VIQLAEHRRVVEKTVQRWRQPLVQIFFDGWCESVGVLLQELMDKANSMAQERLSAELSDAVRHHRTKLDEIKHKKHTGLLGILSRIAHSQLAVVFDLFVGAVRAYVERRDLCRKVICRMLHAHLAAAFELFYEGVTQIHRHCHVVLQAMSRWRRPALAQAWELWLHYCQERCCEVAAVADEQLKYELDEKCRQLEEGLLANRERQKITGKRVVARMLHVHLASVFDGFVTSVVASHERGEMARKVVRRMRHSLTAKAFAQFVSATQGKKKQNAMLDAFADQTQSRFTRYYEKKCFFVLWHFARQIQKKSSELIRESDAKLTGTHYDAWRIHCFTIRNARKLGTRISGAEEVRQVSLALHAWVRWHDRIKMLSAQVAMGKKNGALGSDLQTLAGVPNSSDTSVTALCAFSIWRIHVERCVRSQMQSRISVLIQTIANLSSEPSGMKRSVYSSRRI